MTLFFDLPII